MSAVLAAPIAPPGKPRSRPAWSFVLVFAALGLVLVLARSGLYTAKSELGYWMGVAGGSLMLVLLLYPLSKRAQALRKVMPVRLWFAMHMLMGVLGPVLILLHCTLRIGSLNAAVALWSMVVVASSGFIGRFVYGRLHAGLYGRQRSFAEVAKTAESMFENATAHLTQAPELLAELRAFSVHANHVAQSGFRHPITLFALGRKARLCTQACRKRMRNGTGMVAAHGTLLTIDQFVCQYLDTARDAAQFRAFERVFALWHLLHLPLVGILILSAIFHVIAVHMY
jgi:hypothetical protein